MEQEQLKLFDHTKFGVKALVDSGISKIPRIFIQPPETLPDPQKSRAQGVRLNVPVIDMKEIHDSGRRSRVVEEIGRAAGSIGFFQMVNHGVTKEILEAMVEAVRRFHEQPVEAKMELYSRNGGGGVRFYSNEEFHEPKHWRDSLICQIDDGNLRNPHLLPSVCRYVGLEFVCLLLFCLSFLFSKIVFMETHRWRHVLKIKYMVMNKPLYYIIIDSV